MEAWASGSMLLLELLSGPILLHCVITGTMPPLDEFAERIVDAIWCGAAPNDDMTSSPREG